MTEPDPWAAARAEARTDQLLADWEAEGRGDDPHLAQLLTRLHRQLTAWQQTGEQLDVTRARGLDTTERAEDHRSALAAVLGQLDHITDYRHQEGNPQ